jgi:hypothetical protein
MFRSPLFYLLIVIREITALVVLILIISFNLPLIIYKRFYITQAFIGERRIES